MPEKSVNPDTYTHHIVHAYGLPELAEALVLYGTDDIAATVVFDLLDENDRPKQLAGGIRTLSQEMMCVTGVLVDARGDTWEFTLRRNTWKGSVINVNAMEMANLSRSRR